MRGARHPVFVALVLAALGTAPPASARPAEPPPEDRALLEQLRAACGRMLADADRLLGGTEFKAWRMTARSMKPTLEPGETVVSLTPAAAGWRRGDVVAVTYPGRRFAVVSRIVGLPGDRVRITGSRLHIDGQAVPRTGPRPAAEADAKICATPAQGARKPARRYRETLPGGRSFEILECADDRPGIDELPEIRLPADRYFLLSDNRDNAIDSRIGRFGPVPAGNILGLVVCVLKGAQERRPD